MWEQRLADGLAEAIDALGGGISPEPILARRVGEIVGADLWSVGHFDCTTRQAELEVWPHPPDVELMNRSTVMSPHLHPVLSHWLQGYTDAVMVSSLVSDRRAWRNSEGYELLRRGLGCTETGGIRLDTGTSSIHCLGFARQVDFSPAETSCLQTLRPVIVAIVAHSRWLAAQQTRSQWKLELEVADDHGLTRREIQVLQLLAEGLIASAIARRLQVSTRTVHRHLAHIYDKLDRHDRLSAILYAQQVGLLATPR